MPTTNLCLMSTMPSTLDRLHQTAGLPSTQVAHLKHVSSLCLHLWVAAAAQAHSRRHSPCPHDVALKHLLVCPNEVQGHQAPTGRPRVKVERLRVKVERPRVKVEPGTGTPGACRQTQGPATECN